MNKNNLANAQHSTQGAVEDDVDHAVPESERASRWSLSMAWWALFSAMFWLYVGAASADAVGAKNTIIGMVLSVATYGVINAVFSRYASRTGSSVEMLSRKMLGSLGEILVPLLFAATALYYAVFEGSIVALTMRQHFGGSLNLWYLIAVAYMVPLMLGGVTTWLDKLNGVLLPFYVAGLIAVVVASSVKQGYPSGWLEGSGAGGSLPGWATSYLIYMGVWVLMMYTIDYARLARREDEKFHGTFTFGWVFYAFTFVVNGLIGIYLLSAWNIGGTETGVVDAVIKSLGFFGVLLIVISQTRINTANYYMASINLQSFAGRTLGLRLPRAFWVFVAAVLAYFLMLTDVLSYLLKALSWQGVAVTAWVAIALVFIAVDRGLIPGRTTVAGGVVAWLVSSAVGIALVVQDSNATLAQLAPVITVALAAVLYVAAVMLKGATSGVTEEPELART